jgi:prepilin-type N-terminal cleavage/methylation domain-containing protein
LKKETKNMEKYLEKNDGFTLVEVVVVAVIVLVLAAVAIPLYTGYINDSRKAAAANFAGEIADAAAATVEQGGHAYGDQVKPGGYVTMSAPPGEGIGGLISFLVPTGYHVQVHIGGTVIVTYKNGNANATVVVTY